MRIRYYLRTLAAISAGLLFSGGAWAGQDEDKAALQAMTPQACQSAVTLKDDDLDTTATFDTLACFKASRGWLQINYVDEFVRAFVDKKTGAAKYQVYESISYTDSGWHFYDTVNYSTPKGPQASTVTEISRDVIDCSGDFGCTYIEQVGFDVDEDLLRQEAATYSAGALNPWLYKFGSKAGIDLKDGLMPAEIGGILAAIDAYRSAHALTAPAAPQVAAAPAAPPPPVATGRKRHTAHHN